jgi:hypothetical protein
MQRPPVVIETTEIILETAPELSRPEPLMKAQRRGKPERSKLPVALVPILALVPAAIGLGIRTALRRDAARRARRSALAFGLGGLGAAVGLGLLRWQLAERLTLEPEYTVEQRIGDLEIRRYPHALIAETTVAGLSFAEALAEGHRLLWGYLRGENTRGESLPLTGPITSEQVRGDRPAMAAPETVRRDEVAYDVSVFLLAGGSLGALPQPTDPRVRIRELPPRRVAVLRSVGWPSAKMARARERALLEKVAEAGLVATGAPSFGGYESPSALPFVRRMHAAVEIV